MRTRHLTHLNHKFPQIYKTQTCVGNQRPELSLQPCPFSDRALAWAVRPSPWRVPHFSKPANTPWNKARISLLFLHLTPRILDEIKNKNKDQTVPNPGLRPRSTSYPREGQHITETSFKTVPIFLFPLKCTMITSHCSWILKWANIPNFVILPLTCHDTHTHIYTTYLYMFLHRYTHFLTYRHYIHIYTYIYIPFYIYIYTYVWKHTYVENICSIWPAFLI